MNETKTDVELRTVAVPIAGVNGEPIGVIEFDGLLIELVPALLLQLTVNVYDIPSVKPATVIGLTPAPLVEVLMLNGLLVAVQEVIGLPAFKPAVKETETE